MLRFGVVSPHTSTFEIGHTMANQWQICFLKTNFAVVRGVLETRDDSSPYIILLLFWLFSPRTIRFEIGPKLVNCKPLILSIRYI